MRVTFAVYKLNDNANNPTDGTMLYRTSRNFEYSGFHRLDLDNTVKFKQGDRFSIVSTTSIINNSGTRVYNISASQNVDEEIAETLGLTSYCKAVVNDGESFLYSNGCWSDWSQEVQNICEKPENRGLCIDNFSIKAYLTPTNEEEPTGSGTMATDIALTEPATAVPATFEPAEPATTEPATTEPATTEPAATEPETGDTVTLYFSNNKFWDSVNVYMWKESGGEAAEWPGAAATYVEDNDYGESVYSATVDTAVYDYVIFNGSGGQTISIDVNEAAAEGCGIYCLDTTDDQGHYHVGFYEYTPVEPPSSTYITKNGTEIDLNGTIPRGENDTYYYELGNVLRNFQILGVQKKTDASDTNRSVRYVAVLNDEVLKDAYDYGFISVTGDNLASARANMDGVTLSNAKNIFSWKNTDNAINGSYGVHNSDTKYKYVTFGINNLGDYGVAVKFYVKDNKGNVYYADYTNKNNETYNNCSADWTSLMLGDGIFISHEL